MEELKNLKYVFAIFILSIIIIALLILEPNSKITLFVALFGSLLQVFATYGSMYAAKASEKTLAEMMKQNKLVVRPILYINDGKVTIVSSFRDFEIGVIKCPGRFTIENYGKELAKDISVNWSHNLNIEETINVMDKDGVFNVKNFFKDQIIIGHTRTETPFLYTNNPSTKINFLRQEEKKEDIPFPYHLFLLDILQEYVQDEAMFSVKKMVRELNGKPTGGFIFKNQKGQQKCILEYSDIYDNKYVTEQMFDYRIIVFNDRIEFEWKGKNLLQPKQIERGHITQ